MFEAAARVYELERDLVAPQTVAEIIRLLGDLVEENRRLRARELKFKDEMSNAARSVEGAALRLSRVASVADGLEASEIDEAVKQMREEDE